MKKGMLQTARCGRMLVPNYNIRSAPMLALQSSTGLSIDFSNLSAATAEASAAASPVGGTTRFRGIRRFRGCSSMLARRAAVGDYARDGRPGSPGGSGFLPGCADAKDPRCSVLSRSPARGCGSSSAGRRKPGSGRRLPHGPLTALSWSWTIARRETRPNSSKNWGA